jgi:hypothetical protein
MLRGRDFTGLYNTVPVELYGYPLDLGPRTTPHTGEHAPQAIAFIPYAEFFQNAHGLFADFWEGQNYKDFDGRPLDLPVVRVVLQGDFVFAGLPFSEDGVLDADNIGGNVGKAITRAGPIKGGKNPSGDLAQGGDFESWFFLSPPDQAPPKQDVYRRNRLAMLTGDRASGVDVNAAPANELLLLPGVTEAVAKRILKARESGPFANLEDLRTRAKLTENQLEGLRPFVVLP